MKLFAKKFFSVSLVPVLLGLAVSGKSANAAAEILPRSDFPICSAERNVYCIASVTFVEPIGEKPAVWIPNGTSTTGATFSTFEKVPYSGRYSYDGLTSLADMTACMCVLGQQTNLPTP